MADSQTSDQLVFETPITKNYDEVADGPLLLQDRSGTTKAIVRAAAGTSVAQQLVVGFGSSRQSGETLICGQRPTEWSLLGPADSVGEIVAGLDRTGHVSVVDHTHSRALFRLIGDDAALVLEKICSLDWSDAMTPDGAVASASVAKTTCDIIRHDIDGKRSYLIACDRSFGQYLFDAIVDAGREFGLAVAA